MKILDFDLEGSHFIMEAEVSKRQKTDDDDDDMVCQWLRYLFENTQVYKETDGVVSPFRITGVAWAGYQLTADHALRDVLGRITRNETGKLTVHYVCPELQEFLNMFKKYPAIHGERTIPNITFTCYSEDIIIKIVVSTHSLNSIYSCIPDTLYWIPSKQSSRCGIECISKPLNDFHSVIPIWKASYS